MKTTVSSLPLAAVGVCWFGAVGVCVGIDAAAVVLPVFSAALVLSVMAGCRTLHRLGLARLPVASVVSAIGVVAVATGCNSSEKWTKANLVTKKSQVGGVSYSIQVPEEYGPKTVFDGEEWANPDITVAAPRVMIGSFSRVPKTEEDIKFMLIDTLVSLQKTADGYLAVEKNDDHESATVTVVRVQNDLALSCKASHMGVKNHEATRKGLQRLCDSLKIEGKGKTAPKVAASSPKPLELEAYVAENGRYTMELPKGYKALAEDAFSYPLSKLMDVSVNVGRSGAADIEAAKKHLQQVEAIPVTFAEASEVPGGFLLVAAPNGVMQRVWKFTKGLNARCAGPKTHVETLEKVCQSLAEK